MKVISLCAAVLFLLCACGGQYNELYGKRRVITPKNYEQVYDQWTRDADDFSYQALQDVLHVTATFQTIEFRRAYIVRYAHDHQLTTEQREEMLTLARSDTRHFHRFFVTMSGRRYRESDLTHERSAWRVLLLTDQGIQAEPVEVERLHRPGSNVQVYYPSISPFRHAFKIAFPGTNTDGDPVLSSKNAYVILRFAGALGKVDLKWDFEGPNGGG